jgi:hypothetical protein
MKVDIYIRTQHDLLLHLPQPLNTYIGTVLLLKYTEDAQRILGRLSQELRGPLASNPSRYSINVE